MSVRFTGARQPRQREIVCDGCGEVAPPTAHRMGGHGPQVTGWQRYKAPTAAFRSYTVQDMCPSCIYKAPPEWRKG